MNLCPYCHQEVSSVIGIDVCRDCEMVVEGSTIAFPPPENFVTSSTELAGALTFEEGVTCLDCGISMEVDCLNRASLDAYADLSVDYDLFCPICYSDNLRLHKPKEDKS